MPLTTRSVSPVDLSIRRLPASVQQDELQCVANGTVANLIRQLSSISRHAEQTFSEIHREVLKIDHRTNTLFLRVERLSQKVSQQSQSSNNLRGVADQASLEDAALRKAFKSCNIIDQHSLSRQTLPSSLQEQYQRCDAPPQLNQLNPYREDEKKALRYYTDPGYFFELWRQEILKGCNVEKKRTGRSPTSPSRQRRRQKEQQQQQQQQHQHLSQQQQNFLLNYHASSRSSDYTRFVAPQNQPAGTSRHQQRVHHHQQQQHGGGMLPNSAAEIMHFPAEYQAPQALLASREFMQPPPGMSVIGGGGELTPTLGQQNYNQQPMFRQNTGIAAPSNEQQLPQQQGQNIAFHQMDAQMGQMGVTGAMAFLDDDDDELPPPPPQTILGSAAFAQHSSPAAASSDSPSLPSAAGDGVQLPMEANNHHTIQNVPPPPPPPPQQPAAAGVQFRQKIPPAVSSTIPAPPPPPPPPPPANFAAKKINAATTADGNRTFAGEEEGHNVQRKPSTTSNGTHQGNRSQLLVQIQEGVKLKKVKQEEELAEKRAVATSDDVAAILRKRMEHCLGESDSSSSSAGGSPTADDNEWDD